MISNAMQSLEPPEAAARPLQKEPSRIWDARTGRSVANPAAAAATTVVHAGDKDNRIEDKSVVQRPVAPDSSPTTAHELPPPTVVIHPVGVLRGHARAVSALEWNHDGRRLASGYVDGTVMIWDAWGSV